MTHERETIRKAAATLLTGLTETGANVYTSRSYPLEQIDLPALSIYMQDEEQNDEQSMGTNEIVAELMIVVRAQSGANLDDLMDDILEDVQDAIVGDKRLGGLLVRNARYFNYVGPTFSAVPAEQEIAEATIVYHVAYNRNV